jgi:cytochrome c2
MSTRKWLFVLPLAVTALLILAAPALAGGWAVVTLDELPTQVVAGQSLTIGFVVRQHGRTPLDGLTPQIRATRADAPGSFTVTARPQGETGHYQATLTFPSAGAWDWTIDAFSFPQPMPRLDVSAATVVEEPQTSAAPVRVSLSMVIGVVALVASIGALLLLIRTRAAWAAALTLAAALICVVSFVSAANPSAQAANVQAGAALGPGAAQADLGRALFLAKGCVVCHSHEAVLDARREFAGLNVGPNLSKVARTPDYVRVWLKDPSALKAGTEMPNLGLSSDEIEALIAFLRPGAPVAGEAAAKTSSEVASAAAGLSDCPFTRPPEPPFIPPLPWPPQPPGTGEFWFGNAGLWTALPVSGSWRQLALGEKFWWWSEEFDVSEDTTPDLTVTARRLDGDAPSFAVSEATNGYHDSFNWAMLIGVELASPGCWEFTGEYKGHQLSLVLWVPPE